MSCRIVKHLPSLAPPKDIAGSESLPMDACVIFRGTLTLMRYIQASRRWRPGGWCLAQNLACSTYYAHFGPFLLNREYTLLPVAEAIRLADNLFERYASDGLVFIRPDSVDKSFTGSVSNRASFRERFFGTTFDPTRWSLSPAPRGRRTNGASSSRTAGSSRAACAVRWRARPVLGVLAMCLRSRLPCWEAWCGALARCSSRMVIQKTGRQATELEQLSGVGHWSGDPCGRGGGRE